MQRLILLLGLIASLLAGAIITAQAQEEILSFEATVDVDLSGDFLVTERITVLARGIQIRRGIYRDFPTVSRAPSGLVHRTTFEVLSVTRDGRAEAHHQEPIEGGTRLYIGEADRFLPTNVYTYEIVYRSRHQMGFYERYDEVYWNATGNFWFFPIRKAVATINLPTGATIKGTAVYTGRYRSRDSTARTDQLSATSVRFESGRALERFQGLTTVVVLDKGLIPEPTALDRQMKLLRDNAGLGIALAGAAGVFVFLFSCWHRVGRDPERGVVFPRFEPPRGLSPGELSYVYFRGHRGAKVSKSFVAALVSLGARGKLTLNEEDDQITVRKVRGQSNADDLDLPASERLLLDDLLGSNDVIAFNASSASKLKKATATFQRTVSHGLTGRYFKRNSGYTIGGVVIAVLTLFAFLVFFPVTEAMVVGMLFHFLGGLLVGFGLTYAYTHFIGQAPQTDWPSALFFALVALGISVSLFFAFHQNQLGGFRIGWVLQLAMLVSFAMGATITSFNLLLFAPTPDGQALVAEIEGFRLYLSVAEADRMAMVGAPGFSLKLFERFLPYAIALGVETPWSKSLQTHLSTLSEQERSSYRPDFFSGSSFDASTITRSSNAISSTISSAYASAMPRSSGSSGGGGGGGSGGGGFSGGGGGGGGGGGW